MKTYVKLKVYVQVKDIRNPAILLLSIATGIYLTQKFNLGIYVISGIAVAGFLFYTLIQIYFTRKTSFTAYKNIYYIPIIILAISVGMYADYLGSPHYPVNNRHYLKSQTGRIVDIISRTTGDRITVQLHQADAKAIIYTSPVTLSRGDVIRIDSPLFPTDSNYCVHKKIKRYKASENNIVRKEILNRYFESQRRKGILYSANVNEHDIAKIGHTEDLRSIFLNIRESLENYILSTSLLTKTKEFLITLLLGDKEYLDPQLRKTFSDVGLSHILAVSGLHTGIIASIILVLLFPFNAIGRRKWKYILSLIIIWLFVCLTGFAPSTIRSAVMITCVFTGMLFERRNNIGASLCWAGIVILLITPSSLFDPGFQLSFLCVGSLIVFCDPLNPFNRETRRKLHLIASAILTSLVTTASTWLLVAYYFGNIPTLFLPANLLILPFIPAYIFISIVYFLLSLINREPFWIERILDMSLDLTIRFAEFLSGDGVSVLTLKPELYTVIIWLIGMVCIGFGLHIKKYSRLSLTTGLILLTGSIVTLWLPFG